MGLFSKPAPQAAPSEKICKLCEARPVKDMIEFGICNACAGIMDSKLQALLNALQLFQKEANATDNPDLKIGMLKNMLDYLYEFKVLYVDNDVNPLEQNIDDLIDEVIDCISYAREP